MYQSEQEKQFTKTNEARYEQEKLYKIINMPPISRESHRQDHLKSDSNRNLIFTRLMQKNIAIRSMIMKMRMTYKAIKAGIQTPNFQGNQIVVKDIRKLESQEKSAMLGVCNKLKVLTAKVKEVESTKLEYTQQSYANHTSDILKFEDGNISNTIERQKRILDVLYAIKQKYGVLNSKGIKYYKLQPSLYESERSHSEQVVFYVCLYVQKLLFVEQKLLNFPNSLLYCPIIINHAKNEASISQWYSRSLDRSDPQWQQYTLKINIYHKGTSCTDSIMTSYLADGHQDQENGYDYDRSPGENILKRLKAIRNYVYQRMVFQWIGAVLQGDGDKCYIDILDEFRVEVTKQRVLTRNGQEDGFHPEIIASLMALVNQRDNLRKKIPELRQRISIMFQNTIFTLLTEKTEYRVNFPSTSGSLGLFFYNRKSNVRLSVVDFLKQF